jgi:uncharacterized repeat protein (TIGR01451 family)
LLNSVNKLFDFFATGKDIYWQRSNEIQLELHMFLIKKVNVFFGKNIKLGLRKLAANVLGFGLLGLSGSALADGIYMTNMKTSLTPASVTLLTNPARVPGGQAGDIVEYVLSATVANAVGGPGVYFTAYPAPGMTVLGASFVTDATGSTTRPAGQGGHANNGWGARGSRTPFGAPFASVLNGRENDVYGDTGIFYSTDARTRLFTADSSNIARGPVGSPLNTGTASNGYNVRATFYGAIDAFNLWDADQVNAFGIGGTLGSIPANAAPTSSATVINSIGTGVPPFGAGSSVAGPQTGYTLDNTGNVGPWQRIQYAGSDIADVSDGPATAAGPEDSPTVLDASGMGWTLGDASPLSGATNAVRWSDGLRLLGETVYIKVRVRLDAGVLSASDGVVANFEANGSDNWNSGTVGNSSKDNPWRYFGPTVSQSAALHVKKEIASVNGAPYSGGVVPAGAILTYRVGYMNLGNLPVNITSLTDKLSSGIATVGCTASAPTLSNPSSGVTLASVSAGTTACPAASAIATFGNLPNVVGGKLGALRGGQFTYDVRLASTLANGTLVASTTTFVGTDAVVPTVVVTTLSAATATIGVPAPSADTDMRVTLGAPTSAAIGTTVNATASYVNIGANAAVNPTVTLQLSTGLTGVSVIGGLMGSGVYSASSGVVSFSNPQSSLAAGATLSAAISYVQPSSPVGITASTTADNDTVASNNSQAVNIAVLAVASDTDMRVTLIAPSSAAIGTTVNATASYVNIGSNAAVNPTVTLQLSPGLSNISVNGGLLGNGVYSANSGLVSFPNAPTTLAVGNTLSAAISYLQPSTPVGITATTSATNDTVPANNSQAISIAPLATDMVVVLSAAVSATVGTSVNATASFSNIGANAAANPTVTLQLSPGLAGVLVNGGPLGVGVYSASSGIAGFANAPASLAAGATLRVAISFTQPSSAVNITASTTASNDTVPENNSQAISIAALAVVTDTDMRVSLSAPASAPVGTPVNATVTFANIGTNDAVNPTATLQLSSGLTGVSINSNALGNGVYSASTGLISFANPMPATLAAGATLSAVISFVQPSSAVAITASTNATNDTVPANNIQAISIAQLASDMRVTLNAPASAPVGTPVNATASFANIGTNDAVNPTATLQLSSGLSNVTVNGGLLGNGVYSASTGLVSFANAMPASVTVGYAITASISFVQAGSPVAMTATTGAGNDTNSANNIQNVSIAPLASDMRVILSAPASAPVGTPVNATVTFANIGTNDAVNPTATLQLSTGLSGISINSDVLGNGVYSVSTGLVSFANPMPATLAVNASLSAVISFVQPTSPVGITATTNAINDTVPANNTQAISIAALASDMRVSLSAPASASVGTPVNATASFANIGANDAVNPTATLQLSLGLSNVTVNGGPLGNGVYNASTGLVSFANPMPATLAANASLSAAISFVQPITPVGITATTSATNDSVPANNSQNASVAPLASDMRVLLSAPASAPVGTPVNATASFANIGANAAVNPTATLQLSSGLSNVTVNGGLLGNGVYSVSTGLVSFANPMPASAVTGYTTTVSISYLQPSSSVGITATTNATNDSVPANNSQNASIAPLATDMRVLLSAPTSAPVGTPVNATASFSNIGANAAINPTATLQLSSGLSNVTVNGGLLGSGVYSVSTGLVSFANPMPATLAANASLSAVISFVQPITPVGITATTSATNDTVPVNNSQAISIAPLATDMRVTLNAPASAPVGTPVNATASYANIGANAAINPTVTLQLSVGLSNVTVNAGLLGNGVYSASTGLVTFPNTLGSLAVGSALSAAISFTQPSTPVGITATTDATNDTVQANNRVATIVQPLFSDIAVAIAPMAPTPAGNTTTGVITVSNLGGATTSFIASVSVNGATQTQSFTLAPSGAASYSVVVPVTTSGATVTAVVGSTTVPDSNPANNTASASVRPLFADVTTIIALPVSTQVNSAVLGTVVFTNSAAAGATATYTVGTVTLSNGQLMAYALGHLAPGASATRTFTVTVADAVATSVLLGTSTVATSTPETDAANNVAAARMTLLAPDSSVSGRIFIDANRNGIYDAGDRSLPGYRVELIKANGAISTVVGSALSDASGAYRLDKQYPGTGYRLMFRDAAGNIVGGTPLNLARLTANGNPSTGSNSQSVAVSPASPAVVVGFIGNLTLYAGDNSIGQDLPLDPSGIVYDSVTRQPIGGTTVRLVGPAGFDFIKHLVGGSNPVTTGESGLYQFLFVNKPPSGIYTLEVTPPSGYIPQNAVLGGVSIPQGTLTVPTVAVQVQPQASAPAVGINGNNAIGLPGTQHYLSFKFDFSTRGEVLNNHIPLDPAGAQSLFIEKLADKGQAEVGDSVLYRIKVKNPNAFTVPLVKIVDKLPLGFKLIAGTTTLQQGTATAVAIKDSAIVGFPGSALTFPVGSMAANSELIVAYRVRLGVGSDKGTGINTAQASDGAGTIKSLVARAVVRVTGGVFTSDACVFGKVYVDCTKAAMQSKGDPGIPGVRMYLEDGTNITTDENGQYSICGVRPITHVLKLDPITLPKGARFGITSSRNVGDGDSLFLDLKNGELHRADFREESCTPDILRQVQTRRTTGALHEPSTQDVAKESKGVHFNSEQHKPNGLPTMGGTSRDGAREQGRN